MTTANEEFADLMPHRIKVTTEGATYDDYGREIAGDNEPLIYMGLFDDTTSTARTADGSEITISATFYVAPVPLGSTNGAPVDIPSTAKVEILSPINKVRPVTSIERHYDSEDGVGMLHNIVLRFS